MNRLPISAAMLVKNAERCLNEVLSSLSFVDEVVLLDNGSTDNTLAIAAQFPNVVVHHHEFDGFGAMKNRVAQLAKHDWILSIDSDEIVSPQLAESIAAADLSCPENIFKINRINYYRRRPIDVHSLSPDTIARLYNRRFTEFSNRAVHESLLMPEGANVQLLLGDLRHYSFDNAEALITKMQQYSTLFAQQFAHTRRTSACDAFVHGLAAFIKSYFLKQGFRGGADGLTIAVSRAEGAFYKYVKLHERNQQLTVSLVITAQNRLDALQKTLSSVLQQTVLPHEILIINENTNLDMAQTIAIIQSPVCLQYIGQENEANANLAQLRYRALLATTGDYIVMIDGDMLLEEHFIVDHIMAAQRGCLIQGGQSYLSQDKTEDLLIEPNLYEPLSWCSLGVRKRLWAMRCAVLSRWIWNRKTQNLKTVKDWNIGFFREEALVIDGLDTECITRLCQKGIVRRNLKFAGVAYRLWHKKG